MEFFRSVFHIKNYYIRWEKFKVKERILVMNRSNYKPTCSYYLIRRHISFSFQVFQKLNSDFFLLPFFQNNFMTVFFFRCALRYLWQQRMKFFILNWYISEKHSIWISLNSCIISKRKSYGKTRERTHEQWNTQLDFFIILLCYKKTNIFSSYLHERERGELIVDRINTKVMNIKNSILSRGKKRVEEREIYVCNRFSEVG